MQMLPFNIRSGPAAVQARFRGDSGRRWDISGVARELVGLVGLLGWLGVLFYLIAAFAAGLS